jgi:hypothetical protein
MGDARVAAISEADWHDISGLGQPTVHILVSGLLFPQVVHPPLKNRLITLLHPSESDAHAVCASGDHAAEGHDFRACIDDVDLDLHSRIKGSWRRHKTAMHAQIIGAA